MEKFQKAKYMAMGLAMGLSVAFIPSVWASSGTKTLEAFFRDIKLVIDGNAVIPKDGNGNVVEPFIVDGTTYLPVRAISEALGKDVNWDGVTNTIYISTPQIIPDSSVKLTDLSYLNAEGRMFEYKEEVKDNTDSFHKDCLTADIGIIYGGSAYRDYSLNKECTRIEGSFFLSYEARDFEKSYEIRLKIWGDGKLLYTSDRMTGGVLPVSFKVDISGVEMLKIGLETTAGAMSGEVVLSNVILYK